MELKLVEDMYSMELMKLITDVYNHHQKHAMLTVAKSIVPLQLHVLKMVVA
jgi:hypothetical protein